MPSLIVRVGAVADRSLTDVYAPLVAAGRRAKAAAAREASDAAKAQAKAVADANTIALRSTARMNELVLKSHLMRQRAVEREAAASARREADQKIREVRRAAAEERRETARTSANAARTVRRALDVGAGAMRNLGGVGRAGIGVARDVARGTGVDYDLGSLINKSVSAESKAVNIINQAEMAGQPQGPDAARRLLAKSRGIADSARVDTNQTLDVLAAFQAKSSDLKTGEATLERLAKLAKVSGTSFDDMGRAAGAVNAQLDDTPDRAERLVAIMAHLTKQTADGSVEMSDYSKFVGVIAASSNAFAGTLAQNIGQLGALSQMAMKGGAYTAGMATNSAASFARDITKQQTLSKWESAGINVFSDDKKEKLRGPEDLIIDYIKAKGADRAELAKFFPNVVSKRAVESSLDTYSAAGGGDAGITAVRKEFAKFSSTLDPEKVASMLKATEGTTASKVTKFNNELERAADEVASKLLPKLAEASPHIVKAIDAFAKIASWATDNPGKAITLAITGSIAKAAIGNAISGGLTKILEGAAAGGAAGLLGKVGAAGMIFSIAAATIMIGTAMIDQVAADHSKGVESSIAKDIELSNLVTQAKREARTGGVTEETKKKLQATAAEQEERIKRAQDPTTAIGAIFSDKTFGQRAVEQTDASKIGELKADLAAIQAVLKGTLNVSVTNQPGTPVAAPGVNNAARSGGK